MRTPLELLRRYVVLLWATERLNEYLVKGFTMDDDRLKAVRNIGSDYFDELKHFPEKKP
jgi:hypothetical protein